MFLIPNATSDNAVFKYGVGVHNVFKVSASAFEHCSVPPESEAMATGSDVVTLATPGKKWYICGKAEGRHCWSGMKLVIVVLPVPSSATPAPAYSPPSGPTQFIVGDEMGWTLNFNYTAWAEGKVFRVGDSLGIVICCTVGKIMRSISNSLVFFTVQCSGMQWAITMCSE